MIQGCAFSVAGPGWAGVKLMIFYIDLMSTPPRCWLLLAISTSIVLLRQCGAMLLISSWSNVFTRGQYCCCLRLCVRVCSKHELVRTITCHPFKLESPNLDPKCKTHWISSTFFFFFFFFGGGGAVYHSSWIHKCKPCPAKTDVSNTRATGCLCWINVIDFKYWRLVIIWHAFRVRNKQEPYNTCCVTPG